MKFSKPMIASQLSNQFLEQSSDLIWMVDSNFQLVYANPAYFSFFKEVIGEEKSLGQSFFAKRFDEQFVQKWKTYFNKAFNNESFEIEERFIHCSTAEIYDLSIYCKPIVDETKNIIAVACQSKDCKTSNSQKFDSNKLLDTSLDVYCIVNEHDYFTYVSAASYNHWGYLPEEMIGKSIHDFILKDDSSKTNKTISKIISGDEIKSFFNRYRKKDGSIAHNLWSAKWDANTNLRYAVAKDAKEIIQEKQHLKLLESVITNTHDAVMITEAEPFDLPGPKIIYVNEAFTKMTGYTAEEVIGKTPRILQGPKSNHQELKKLSKAIRNWESFEITTINYKKNGEEFWINFKVSPVADETGWYTHWIAIERDVTESKRIEENLIKAKEIAEENERKMKEAQKLAHLGSWYYDVINKKSQWSDETYTIWGLDPKNTTIDLIDHQKLVHPKDWERFNSVIINATEKGIPYKMELELVRPDGTYKTVNTIGEPIFDNKNKVIAFRGTTQDISERIVIENELRDAKEKAEKSQYAMAQASKLAKIGYWDLDFTTNKLTWSDYIYELYNLSPNEDILKYLEAREFFDSQSQKKIITATKELIKHGTPYDLELRMINSNNEEIFVRNVVQPVYNEAKEIVGKRGIIQNITAEKYLQDLNREVAKMVKIGSWSVDLEKETVFWSEQIHELHETDSKTYIPNLEEGINFYRADFRDMVQSSVANAIKNGEGWDFEAVIVTAKKKEIWIRSIGNAEFINDKCVRLYGGLQDIDIRKQAEIRLQSLANNLPGVVFQYFIYTNGTDALKNVTKGSVQVWGYEPEVVMDNNHLVWDRIKIGGEFEKVQKSILESIESKSKWSCRFKYVLPSGELKILLGSGSPDFLADGTIQFNSIILDVTQEVKNEELLKQTAQIAKVGSWEMNLINQKGENMYWSPMIREILEIDGDFNPTLTDGIEFHVGESQERIKQSLELLIKEGVEFDEEILLRTAKGNERWSRAIGKSEVVDHKRIRIYGSYQDIHEKKLATLALEKSLRELQDYKFSLDQSAIIAFTDQKGVITSVNDNFCKISGYDQNEIIGQTHRLINSNHHPKEFFDNLWTTISSGNVYRGEIKNKTKSGKYYWVDTTIVPFLDENNKPKQYLAIRFDITDRKIAEESNLFKANFLKNINQAAIATNLQGIVNYWNKAAEDIYGWKIEEAIGKNILELTPNAASLDQAREIMESLNKGETWKGEFSVKRKDGSQFPALVSNSPIYDKNNNLIGIIGISSDITIENKNKELLKRYTLELERSNEELEQFAYVASHDLQEPLRMISSFMDLLQRKYGDKIDEKGLQYINFATQGAKRMKNLILDLLEYSRAGRTNETFETVDLNQLLFEFKELRRRVIEEKKATIIYEQLPVLQSYNVPITQIFHCLLDNAMNYSKENIPPTIEIQCTINESDYIFSVKDNGIGIHPNFHDKIFMIFQRLHNNDKFAGTGIGLSLVKRQVEFLGGSIRLESEEGKGTTFFITIPKK